MAKKQNRTRHYFTAPLKHLCVNVAALVGDDGTGDIGLIVRQALKDDPSATVADIAQTVRETREEASRNGAHHD